LLEPIHVPSRELEAARDLVRAREDARLDRMRDRHRLSKFCLRHGRPLPTSSWTVVLGKWLSEQRSWSRRSGRRPSRSHAARSSRACAACVGSTH
jgi:transposase